jgi:hypothetical protein
MNPVIVAHGLFVDHAKHEPFDWVVEAYYLGINTEFIL